MTPEHKRYAVTLGQVIRRARKNAKMSLRELGERAKLGNPSRLSKYERGEHLPRIDSLIHIGEAVDVEPWRLLRAAGKMNTVIKAQNALVRGREG